MKVIQLTNPIDLEIQYNTISVNGIIIPRIDSIDFENNILLANSYYIDIQGTSYTKIIKTDYIGEYSGAAFTAIISSVITEDILLQKLIDDNTIDGTIIEL